MPGQITNAVKKVRSASLIATGNESTIAYRKDHIGKSLDVLFEEKAQIDGNDYFIGFSKEYIKCAIQFNDNQDLTNCICEVKATGLTADGQYLIVEI